VIKTQDLTKVYGELRAIDNLTLELARGDVYGFIGPNGSGKTTTMRIVATLLQPTWGEAYVCDYSIYTHPKEIRRLIGFMPDFFGVYDDMKVIEYLEFFAAAYRIRGPARRKVCDDMLALVGLGYKRDALVTSLSRGMTQRLGLARVLLHDPQVLLLDEPASGLDPRARIEIRALLRELRGLGKTIMVSSHILPELADVCNKIGIIERGKLLISAEVTDVMRHVRRQPVLHVGVCGTLDAAAKVLEGHAIVEKVEIRDSHLLATLREGTEDYSDLPTLLIQAGYKLTTFKEEEINLETAFMALTKGITA
jgi:ABC-2 type transport system ATP-binding protein